MNNFRSGKLTGKLVNNRDQEAMDFSWLATLTRGLEQLMRQRQYWLLIKGNREMEIQPRIGAAAV